MGMGGWSLPVAHISFYSTVLTGYTLEERYGFQQLVWKSLIMPCKFSNIHNLNYKKYN